jgi:hypothetical protein
LDQPNVTACKHFLGCTTSHTFGGIKTALCQGANEVNTVINTVKAHANSFFLFQGDKV